MKLAWLLVLALLLGGALWWLASRSDGPTFGPSARPASSASTGSDAHGATETVENALAEAESAPTPYREIAPASPPAEAAASASPRCRILGRLVDDTGAPLPGIEVVVHPVGAPWAEGVQLPKVEMHGYAIAALTAVSDAEGRFAFEEAVPTADWISLTVRPDPFHARLGRHFGPAGGRNEPPLVAGDNDLGDLALATTGAVEGTVRGEDGSPLSHAEIMLLADLPDFFAATRAEDDGRYLLAHVPPGTWRFDVKADGWLAAKSDSVDVRARQTTRAVDFVLATAPVISGVVVDESDKPLSAVDVRAWPRSGGRGAFTSTAADGSFTLHLPQDEPYHVEIDHAGFESYGGHGSEPVPPGTAGVRIVLRRGRSMTFVVVDAASGAPIERYGIEVQQLEGDGWSTIEGSEVPTIRDQARGECSVVLPRGKSVVHVEAPDRVPFGGDIAEDATGTARQTIRLARGSSLTGRVLRGDSPAAGVGAVLERCSVKIDASLPDEPPDDRWFSENYRFDLSSFVGRRRDATTGADGRFRFGSLAAGTYSLALRENTSAPWIRESLSLGAEGEVELGDLRLEAGSAIRGRLRLPADRSPQGWQVILDEGDFGGGREVSADGRFLLEGLRPGKHQLRLRPPNAYSTGVLREVDLPPGTTVEVEVDGSLHVPCELRVRVVHAGRPLPGLSVYGICETSEGVGGSLQSETDQNGRTGGHIPPCGALRLEVRTSSGMQLAKSPKTIDLPPGGVVETEIEVIAGNLTIVFPEGFEVPTKAAARVSLDPPGDDPEGVLWASFSTPDFPFFGEGIEWTSRIVDLGLVPVGDYEVTVVVSRLQPRELDGSIQNFTEPVSLYHGRIELRRDGRAECALAQAPTDR